MLSGKLTRQLRALLNTDTHALTSQLQKAQAQRSALCAEHQESIPAKDVVPALSQPNAFHHGLCAFLGNLEATA